MVADDSGNTHLLKDRIAMPHQPQMCFLQPVQIAELQQPEPGGAVIVQAKKMPQAPAARAEECSPGSPGSPGSAVLRSGAHCSSLVWPPWVEAPRLPGSCLLRCALGTRRRAARRPWWAAARSCGPAEAAGSAALHPLAPEGYT